MTHQDEAGQPQVRIQHVALFAVVTILWGANWPAMKLGVGGFDPWTFRVLVLPTAAAVLFSLARLKGDDLSLPRRLWWPMVIPAVTVTGWHLLTAYGLMSIGGGRAAIIAFTMPIWAALLGTWFLGERVDLGRAAALALGLVGLALLLASDFNELDAAPIGALLMAIAALTWAIQTVAVRSVHWRISPLVLTAWQLLLGWLPIGLYWAVAVGPQGLEGVPASAWFGWAYTTFIAMVICFASYTWLVTQLPALVAAIGLMAIPAVGLISSALVLGEPVATLDLVALAFVLAGQAIVLRPRRKPKPSPAAS